MYGLDSVDVMQIVSFGGPPLLLLVIVTGYLATVFEPYFAWHSKGGAELREYHAQDLKLRLIAQWWAARLTNQEGALHERYDETNEAVRRLCSELHDSLVRHRFITGDDPRMLYPGDSSVVGRARKRAGFSTSSPTGAKAVDVNFVDETAVMLISPTLVKIVSGQIIWRGKPPEYKSRFNDFYSEP